MDNVQLNIGVGGETIATDDIGGIQHEKVKIEFGSDGTATMVDAANPLPIIDNATQTALAAILLKIISAPSTESKQDAANALLTTIAAIIQPLTDAQLRAVPIPVSGTITVDTSLLSTAAKQDTLIAKDFATQTTLAAILAKLIASPATEANQTTANSSLSAIDTKLTASTSILNGQTTVTTAGTRVVLAASTACKSVTIKAFITNTGIIYVGNSTVSSANGFRLNPGDSISMDISNLNTVNIDSSVNSQSVSYLGVN